MSNTLPVPVDAGDDELEALLAETTAADDSDPLESLMSESMAQRREEAEARESRERLKRGGLSSAERKADAERIAAWEARHEWEGVANVATFTRHRCMCGAEHMIFTGLMQRQVHRHLKMSQRWTAVDAAKADLPNEVAIRTSQSPVCKECALGKGWDLATATEWITD